MSRPWIASMVLLFVVGAVLWGIVLQAPGMVGASGHSATRTLASPWALPESEVQVTIAVQDYGAFAQVVETLPEGFSFVGSSLPEVAVEVGLGTLTFTLLGEKEFTYTVQAPAVEATYSFSGIVRDQNKTEEQVGGGSSLRVGPAPTPTPQPIPTPTPTPEPTPTSTPQPTPTPTPLSTPSPTPASTPSPTPSRGPTAAPTPALPPVATLTPTPIPASTPVPSPSPAFSPTPTMPAPTPSPSSTDATTPTPRSAPTPTAIEPSEASPVATPTSTAGAVPRDTGEVQAVAGEVAEQEGVPRWLIAVLIIGVLLAVAGVGAYAYRRKR